MAMLRGYFRNEHGRVAWRWYDSPADFHPGVVDSPDKLENAADGPVGPPTPPRLPTVTGEVYGEVRRGPGRPRKVG